MINEFKDEDFDAKIKNEDVSILQFSASWCGPCKVLKPIMEKLYSAAGGQGGMPDMSQMPDMKPNVEEVD